MQLLRSVRFENNSGEGSISTLHPHPCLLRRALTAARSVMVAAEMSAPTSAQHTAKPARNAASMTILLPYTDSHQRPAHATGNGARDCHRKGRTPQLSSSHCVACCKRTPYRRQRYNMEPTGLRTRTLHIRSHYSLMFAVDDVQFAAYAVLFAVDDVQFSAYALLFAVDDVRFAAYAVLFAVDRVHPT